MENEKYLDLMLARYKTWLEKGVFTREYAAYEYMKRNPYFLNLATYYNYLSSEKQSLKVSNQNYSMDDITHILKQVFLYSGYDLAVQSRVKNDILSQYLEFDDEVAESYLNPKRRWYSDIYEEYFDELIEDNSNELSTKRIDIIKKKYPIDLDLYTNLKFKKRWLEHLIPSMYIKINPLEANEDILHKLKALLGAGDKYTWDGTLDENFINKEDDNKRFKYSALATPEIILDERDLRGFTFDNGKHFDLASAKSLIIYDLIELFKIDDAVKLKNLLEENFGEDNFHAFDPYFDYRTEMKNHEVKFKTDYILKNKREVQYRISGGYLDLIYPRESIDIHRELVEETFTNKDLHKYKKTLLEDKCILLGAIESANANIFSGVVGLDTITTEEYTTWIESTYSKLNNEKVQKKIFTIILL